MLYAKCGSGQSMDCPARSMDPSFLQAIRGFSGSMHDSDDVDWQELFCANHASMPFKQADWSGVHVT